MVNTVMGLGQIVFAFDCGAHKANYHQIISPDAIARPGYHFGKWIFFILGVRTSRETATVAFFLEGERPPGALFESALTHFAFSGRTSRMQAGKRRVRS